MGRILEITRRPEERLDQTPKAIWAEIHYVNLGPPFDNPKELQDEYGRREVSWEAAGQADLPFELMKQPGFTFHSTATVNTVAIVEVSQLGITQASRRAYCFGQALRAGFQPCHPEVPVRLRLQYFGPRGSGAHVFMEPINNANGEPRAFYLLHRGEDGIIFSDVLFGKQLGDLLLMARPASPLDLLNPYDELVVALGENQTIGERRRNGKHKLLIQP
jgi:hypothetical protein